MVSIDKLYVRISMFDLSKLYYWGILMFEFCYILNIVKNVSFIRNIVLILNYQINNNVDTV